MERLPSGTLTLLFTDIEGSTRLLDELGDAYAELLAEHRKVLRAAFAAHHGVEVDTEGDAFFYVFSRASDAVDAAAAAQEALAAGRVRIRIGIHTGQPTLTDEGYVGMDVHRAARIMAAGHGGQVVISETTVSLVGTAGLLDLGHHRLKDMAALQHLFQLGERTFPPLKTLNATNLPVPGTRLLGREAEVADLISLIARGARLVTLTGPGGIGKTRLALQVASELVGQFADGVFWVPLADVPDPDLVGPEIGNAIGAAGDVATHLRNRQTLLLLDNLEQVLDAAPMVSDLVSAAPRCRFLVTSRAPLRLAAEHEYPLDLLTQESAIELFCDRALAVGRRIEPSPTVAEICRRLDNLPLAIELAAARARLLDPPALLARLERRLPMLTGGARDAPARQRTLRATIDWSYGLLESDGRRLFCGLSVFSGGATAEAAAAVCDADLDGLGALVEMNLLKVTDDGRFTMLETLREFGAEQLAASGEADVLERRHANYYAQLAQQMDDDRHRVGGGDATEQVAEAANIRAAAAWASRFDGPLWMQLLSSAVWVFVHGSYARYRQDLEAALRSPVSDPRLRGRAEEALSFVLRRQGEYEASIPVVERAIAFAQEAHDDLTITYARQGLAFAYSASGRFDDALGILHESEADARKRGDGHDLAQSLIAQSDVALTMGNYELARSLALEGRAAVQPYADPDSEMVAAINFATASLELGLVDDAERVATESLEVVHARADIPLQAACVQLLSGVAAERGDTEHAARLMGLLNRLHAEIDVGLGPAEQRLQDQIKARLATLDVAMLATATEAGRALSIDEVIAMGRTRAPS